MNPFDQEIVGKKVLVFGLGRQGGGAGDAAWLEKHGAIVRLSDRDTTLVSEGQNQEQIDWAEIVIKNPGVSDDHDLIVYAKSQNKPVYTSVALFVKYSPIKTIGVTGTRGKSTTVALIEAMLASQFPGKVISGGNIAGTSCLSIFDQVEGKDYAVLELSSFQLHNFHELKVSPNIAIITNLYPDHLNRYPSMREYQSDKEAIVAYQHSSDITLFNLDNPGSVAIANRSPGQKIGYSASEVGDYKTKLPGTHNQENIAAAVALSHVLNLDSSLIKQCIANFAGVPSRQEVVTQEGGISYINDTTSTTPTAAIKALQAATSPTIWITGGDTKNLPFVELISEVENNTKLKKIVVLGSKNIPDYIAALKSVALDKIVGSAMSMEEAVTLARSVAASGDAILLSPGFASFDLFKNEFDRGDQFNAIVRRL